MWLARHLDLRTDVAIKILRAHAMRDAEHIARFDREARVAASLKSPHVTRILDVGHHRGLPFMVMELLVGNDLAKELEQRGPLPVGEAVGYLLQACEAMIEAHDAGIIHRDLKPENLFLATVGGSRILKVLDFGISKFQEAEEVRVTQTQSSFGTPLYMSPEQVRSTKNVDARADIWSLGVIAHELLTGEPPFAGETAAAVAVAITVEAYPPLSPRRGDVPPELDRVVARALEKNRDDRFASVRELANALRPFKDIPAPAGRVSIAPRTSGAIASKTMRVSSAEVPTERRRSAPAWLYGVVGLLFAAVTALTLVMMKRSGESRETGATPPSPTSDPSVATTSAPSRDEAPAIVPAPVTSSAPSTVSSEAVAPPSPPSVSATPTTSALTSPSRPTATPPTTSTATPGGEKPKPPPGGDPNPHHI